MTWNMTEHKFESVAYSILGVIAYLCVLFGLIALAGLLFTW